MEDKDLQLENGNYTRIVNRVIEELVKTPLLGAELAICLFVIRKTYGYNKLQDQISITQFEIGVKRSRPTITKALKNLQLVNILQLVKVGDSKTSSSIWRFNKYYDTWKLVKTPKLVKDRTPTSKEKLIQLVKTPKHTKDNTKDNTKEREADSPPTPKDTAIKFFKMLEGKDGDYQEFIEKTVISTKIDKDRLVSELKKFYEYWTELNQTGKKQRWEKEKVFEVKRRLTTWMNNNNKWSSNNNTKAKKIWI